MHILRQKCLNLAVVLLASNWLAITSVTAGETTREPSKLMLAAHHATATVEDIDRAVAWYGDVLGFEVVERGVRGPEKIRYAELKIPGYGIGLVQFPGTTRSESKQRPMHPIWLHIVFSVPDIAAAKHLLAQRGVVLRSVEHGGRIQVLTLNDSEGNEIEIVPATS